VPRLLTGQGYLASGEGLWSGALERETEREHTETPGVRGEMRTTSQHANRQRQRGAGTGNVEGLGRGG